MTQKKPDNVTPKEPAKEIEKKEKEEQELAKKPEAEEMEKESNKESNEESNQEKPAKNNKHNTWLVIGLVISFLAIFLFILQQVFYSEKEPLYIAIAGPINQVNGEAMVNGVQLYLDQINAAGGIAGHQVKLIKYDDDNQANIAQKVASQIAEDQKSLAVIGHYGSSTSLAAAPIYQQRSIAAVSGSSTADELTIGNDWYFRTIFNNSDQAALLAHYVYKVLKYQRANILYHDNAYGSTLASTFYRHARTIGLEINHQWHFNSPENFEYSLQQLTQTLAASPKDKTVLFLATHSTEAVRTLVALKELEGIQVEIIGADALSSANFLKKLSEYPREQIQPGYYSDGVYAIAPLLFDLGNQLSQNFRHAYLKKYQEFPSITSAIYYDAAIVVVNSIKKMINQGIPPTIKQQRQQVKTGLWQLNKLENGLDGITATLYFNQHGDAVKSIPMGIYKNGNLVAAMHQYQPLQTVQNINNLLSEMLEHRIVEINGKFMSLAQVVYAGLDFTEISELDNKNSTFTADFYLWFRYQGDFDDSAIELINLFQPAKRPLGEPISIWHSPIESGVTTKTYRLKTQFKVELDLRNYPLDQQQLAIYFRHNHLTKNKLIYVVDVQGLGLDKPLKQENAHKFFSIGGWHVNQISFFQDNQTNDSTWGISDFFNTKQRIEYSQFNTVISINRHLLNFILKSLLPVIFLIILGYVSFFVSAFASKLGIGTNLILATSLFHLKLASELPQINYVVLIEYLFYLIYLLALFIIVISVLAHLYEEDESKKALVNRLNIAGKIIYPLVLVIFIIVITYLNIDLIIQAM